MGESRKGHNGKKSFFEKDYKMKERNDKSENDSSTDPGYSDNDNSDIILSDIEGEGNQSLDAMINRVDHITSQSLAIQLNASRVRVKRATLNSTPTPNTTTTATHSPRTVTNTLESGTPSSNTPAPQSHRNNRTQTHLSQQLNFTSDQLSDGAATMLIHEDASTYRETVTPKGDDEEDRIGHLDVDETEDETEDDVVTPDPDNKDATDTILPSMEPIAETHSHRHQHHGQHPNFVNIQHSHHTNRTHNTLGTHSPSHPRLLNNDTNLSTLSPHSPHTPNTPCNQSFNMLYPEYIDDEHDNDTSSFFTDGSSAYNTPKSLTTKSNAHGLLSQYNSRKSSKPINSNNHSSRSRHRSNSKSKNDTHPRLKSRDKSKANKSHSHRSKSRRRSDNKNNNNNNMNK